MRPHTAGTKVRTICHDDDTSKVTAARPQTQWEVLCTVVEVLDGKRYVVRHPDGTTAEYANIELMRVL